MRTIARVIIKRIEYDPTWYQGDRWAHINQEDDLELWRVVNRARNQLAHQQDTWAWLDRGRTEGDDDMPGPEYAIRSVVTVLNRIVEQEWIAYGDAGVILAAEWTIRNEKKAQGSREAQ